MRGYTGGISQLKAFLALLKKAEPEQLVRFETPPGQQMQADLPSRPSATTSSMGAFFRLPSP